MHCGYQLGIGSVFFGQLWFLQGIGSVVFGIPDRDQELDWLRIYWICYTKERCSVIPENRSAYHCLVIVSLQGGKITIPTVKHLLLGDLWTERFAMYNVV